MPVIEGDRDRKAFESLCKQLAKNADKAEAGDYNEVSAEHAKVRIDIVKGYWKALLDAHLNSYPRESSAVIDEQLEKAEANFTKVMAVLKEKVESRKVVEVRGVADILNTWGEFDGDLKKWPAFKDRFMVAVHDNPAVPLVYKFQHLVRSVRGSAAQALGEWRHTEDNYPMAWERLCHLYDKKYKVGHDLLYTLVKLPTLKGKASAAELQKMANVTYETLRQLGAQGVPVEYWDVMIVFLLHSRLDDVTANAWELKRVTCAIPEEPTVTEMLQFLEQQAAALQRPVWEKGSLADEKEMNEHLARERLEKERHHLRARDRAGNVERGRALEQRKACSCCGSLLHPVWNCSEFEALSMTAKRQMILDKGLCGNCLKVGHHTDRCFQGPCAKCPGRQMHNSLLCPGRGMVSSALRREMSGSGQASGMIKRYKKNDKININKNYLRVFASSVVSDLAFLPTAMVMLRVGTTEIGPVRALLDSGAQPSLISWQVIKSIETECRFGRKTVFGIGSASVEIRKTITLEISPWFESGESVEEEFWVMPRESEWQMNLPASEIDPSQLPPGKLLADPVVCLSREVEMILGVNVLAKVIEAVRPDPMHNVLQIETKLGLVILGGQYLDSVAKEKGMVAHIECSSNNLEKALRKLWESDEVKDVCKQTIEEREVEEIFVQTHVRDRDGRFVVTMPMRKNFKDLGSTREIALKRFYILERRLNKDQEVKEKYVSFMREYERLGHMREVGGNIREKGEIIYHIPHHCVTSKFRVVFDASCKSTTGLSLNDVQLLGERLQRDLQEILMRFRRHKIGLVADIKMMFRQVRIVESQWNLQRIFWREDMREDVKEYWLTVNTYGLTSAAHNAVRSMIECARNCERILPKAADVIINDMYMDDLVTGVNKREEASAIVKEIDKVLKSAGFELRKWKSNCERAFETMDRERIDEVMLEEKDKTKVLGLKWLVKTDEFTFKVISQNVDGKLTKRKIVSCVAQLYDPNGFVAPVSVRGKLFIQDLWREGLGWDDEVSLKVQNEWHAFWNGIQELEKFRMPRWLGIAETDAIEFHGFSDASERAYGAVVYMRKVLENGRGEVLLLTAKSRVAPVKTLTIPRLELAAAELLSRLMRKVMKIMEREGAQYVLWTDSMITLHWVRKSPSNLRTFVANRVASIQTHSNIDRWRHVGTKDNPADMVSRGVAAKDLVDNEFWLRGPKWLELEQAEWPHSSIALQELEVEKEEKKGLQPLLRFPNSIALKGLGGEREDNGALQPSCSFSNSIALEELEAGRIEEKVVCAISIKKDWVHIYSKGLEKGIEIIEYFEKLERLVRVLAYVFKYIMALRKAVKERGKRRGEVVRSITGYILTAEEKGKAIRYVVMRTQEQYYRKELSLLEKGMQVQTGSKIEPLKPFLDKDRILRVGGRLRNADIQYSERHPIIIPNGSVLMRLIIESAHRESKHGGGQVMTQYIRERYWIPRIRSEIRVVIHRCVLCVRHNQRMETQLMADLPGDRVNAGKAFLVSGVDFAGPFRIKRGYGKGRWERVEKGWVAVFVCMKTRAVHLDLVANLTTLAFIACFERFVARRGRCERIYSDNGTTFKGADRELRAAYNVWTDRAVIDQIGAKGTEWRFMTPAAPHQGGIYEAAVKSMKHHLVRVVGTRELTSEQLITLLTGIEAIMNSRPLYPLSNDPTDNQALTPGHFLVGEPLVLPLPLNVREQVKDRGVRLWRERKVMLDHFWKVWKGEYLSSLQERKKWRREVEPVKVGQMVVMKSEVMPPAAWALGRISNIFPGQDGRIRNVEVETAHGVFLRPVQKICVLPTEVRKMAEKDG